MMTKTKIIIADQDHECNASLFIKDILDDIVRDLTFAQKRDVVTARQHNWRVLKGEKMRFYIWDKGKEEEMYCYEIPAIADICTELDLWRCD